MKVYSARLLLLAALTALSGCHQNPSHPARDGNIKEAVWPAPEKAKSGTGRGVFILPESLALLNKGLTRDQVYFLIGRPHFDEGIFAVREWDYLLHFRTPGGGVNRVTSCQLKIIYNSDKRVSGIYWKSANPESQWCPPDTEPQIINNRYTLSTDIFFGFNQYQPDKTNHEMLKGIDDIISDIRKKGEYESISVYGYTDWQGSRSYNRSLSALRAASVAHYLTDKGLPENKVFPEGMGESAPATRCPGLTEEKLTACLRPDRKVVIVVHPLKRNGR
ncbi:TPA: outer membrane protein assembly factor BamE [Salmonella enterica]|nr:outer membrane protein assembly factor BamE [Salmonella enterica]